VMTTADFFTQYDSLAQQENALVGTEERLCVAEESLAKAKVELAGLCRHNVKLTTKMAERRSSIETCQKDWFLGTTALQPQLWFKGGVEGKIARQEAKLAAEEAELPGSQAKESQLKRQVTTLEKEVEQLASNEAQKEGLHAQRNRLFEQAVAGAPTPAYHELVARKTTAVQAAESEAAVVRQVEEAVKQFDAAHAEYGKALKDMNQAARENSEAQHNISNMEQMRNMDEQQRDRMMGYAQSHANAGASHLAQAVAMIPAAARSRHPQLCPAGQVQANPVAPAAGLATGMGSMMQAFGNHGFGAGMMVGGGIQGQIQQLSQQQASSGQQLGQAQALLSACKQDAAAATAAASQAEALLTSEKQQIFNSLRAAVGVDAIQYAPGIPVAAMPTAIATPVAAP